MKKLLTSEVCRTREQCISELFTAEKSKHTTGKKRKENFEMHKENDNLCRREGINHLG